MNEHASIPYLREAVIFLAAAGIIVPIFHRLRVSPVLGYLGVGAAIGPFGLGLFAERIGVLRYAVIDDLEGVQSLASLGVIFLLFMIGLELSLERLWALRRLVFGLGTLQVLVSATVIGAIASAFGNSPPASILLGSCLALSSTAIVMQLLAERHQVGTTLGRTSLSILLLQDLAVVPILFLVGVLGAQIEDVETALLLALAKTVGAIAIIVLFGRQVLRPLFRLVSSPRSPELFLAVTLLAVIGTAAASGTAGLSMALGAFLAGLLLAESEYRHEIEVDIEPFKGLLLGLFFLSVGMGIDFRIVAQQPVWVAASVAGLFAIKAVIATALCLAFGIPRHTAFEAGLLLGQGGEFGFIVVGLSVNVGLVPEPTGQFMLIVTGLTMLLTPLVAYLGERSAAAIERHDHAVRGSADAVHVEGLEGHVVIAGFGRVGQALARIFEAQNLPYIALDLNGAAVGAHRAAGRPVFYGDASRPEMLRRARVESAQAFVITMDDPAAAQHTVDAVHRHWPWLPVVARARDVAHARALQARGATRVVPETVESSLQLAARVLEGVGVPEEAVSQIVAEQRELEVGQVDARPSPLDAQASARRAGQRQGAHRR